MQLEFNDYSQALTSIVQLLQSNEATRSQPEDVRTVALRKLWRAVDRTRMFFASVEGESEELRRQVLQRPNPELNQLWSEASLALMVLAPELAYRLRFKAEFWSNPYGWRDVPGIDIKIETIAEEARGLMAPRAELPAQSPRTPAPAEDPERLDIFISHASEDKEAIASPLAHELRQRGYGVWYDNFNLMLGDAISSGIDRGLAICRHAAVILSPNYITKEWTRLELGAIFSLEVSEREKRILPILHQLELTDLGRFSAMLSDRVSISTGSGVGRVVEEVARVLDVARSQHGSHANPH